mgnify:CR=1 FL=1
MLLKWGFIAYPKFKWRFPIIDLSIITHRPHSWAAYYDLLALIWNIMGVNKFWKWSQIWNIDGVLSWLPWMRQVLCFNLTWKKVIFYCYKFNAHPPNSQSNTPMSMRCHGCIKHAAFLPSPDSRGNSWFIESRSHTF